MNTRHFTAWKAFKLRGVASNAYVREYIAEAKKTLPPKDRAQA